MKYFMYVCLFDNSGLWLGDYPIGTEISERVLSEVDDNRTVLSARLVDINEEK